MLQQQFSPSAGRPHDDLEEYMDIGTALGRSQRQNKPKKQPFVTKKLDSCYIKLEHDIHCQKYWFSALKLDKDL